MWQTERTAQSATKNECTGFMDLINQQRKKAEIEADSRCRMSELPPPDYVDYEQDIPGTSDEHSFLDLRMRHDNALQSPKHFK